MQGRAVLRKTIAAECSLSGPSLATGAEVTVTLRPAEAGTGVLFRHVPTGAAIPADLDHVAEVPQCTALQLGDARIDFAEHLLAVLSAAGVTDLVVDVDGGEVPLLDGSAAPYWRAIREAGVVDLAAEIAPVSVTGTGLYHLRESAAIVAVPGDEFGYLLDHQHPLIGRQYAAARPDAEGFAAIVRARTFSTESEARALIAARGSQGGSVEMAIIAFADRLSAPEPFPNSFAAHKVIDLMGDLYLLGRPLQARVVACRTGHADNRALARKIAEAYPE